MSVLGFLILLILLYFLLSFFLTKDFYYLFFAIGAALIFLYHLGVFK